jgi:hypothetical protein
MTLGSLEFLYTPSADVAADLRYLVDILGGEEVFAIEDGGVKVAMVSLGGAPANPPDRPPRGRPADLPVRRHRPRRGAAGAGSAWLGAGARGWAPERSVELPPGPAITFRTPGGLRMAIYQPIRPFVVESFRGRHDFG